MDHLPINSIIVGERRRTEAGDIEGLAKSIDKHGLLHPIVIDANNNLVAGGRRLAACQSLGYDVVPVRFLRELTHAELREVELEENLRRKDLTDFERSRAMVERVEIVREIAEGELRTESVRNSGPGRPSVPGSVRDASARMGVPAMTINDAQRHVETAEAFSALQKPDWRQYHVLEARAVLEQLPEPDRAPAVELIDQPGIPPRDALDTLANLSVMPAPERQEIFQLAQSDDSRDRSLAITRAANKPAMPDPRWTAVLDVEARLRKAASAFREDDVTSDLLRIADDLKALLHRIHPTREAA